jgi:tRNA(Ile)-lysidine synthase
MLDQFLGFINKHHLFASGDKLLLAVSGGKDSMAMLHLFLKTNYAFEVAHCNFNLRGEASNKDQELVEKYCHENNITCFSKSFDTLGYSKEKKVSIEMVARELRYSWFDELLNHRNLNFIITAHHLTDSLETLVLNISKGTGPKGLRSIPIKQGKVRRPLLFATSDEIREYLSINDVPYREDASNQENIFQRNKIRNLVLPLLKEINPGLENTHKVNLERFENLNAIFLEHLNQFELECVIEFTDKIIINITNWAKNPGLALIIEEFLKKYHFNFHQVKDILEKEHPNSVFHSSSHSLYVKGFEWDLVEIESTFNFTPIAITDTGSYPTPLGKLIVSILDTPPDLNTLKIKSFGFVDLDKVDFPITLRLWQIGDAFRPYGMKGKKYLSDFLNNIKLPEYLRKKQLILEDQKQIIWVVNERISEDVKVSKSTKQYLKIQFLKN